MTTMTSLSLCVGLVAQVAAQIPTSPEAKLPFPGKFPSHPKFYSDVMEGKRDDVKYWDYIETYQVPELKSLEKYEFSDFLGDGKYGDAYLAKDTTTDETVVIKTLKSEDRPEKVRRELLILDNVQGGPNIINFRDLGVDEMNRTSMVFDFVNNTRDYKSLYASFTDMDIRYYLREAFVALDFIHSKGIIHRDIKPHNVMIDHAQKKLRIIDFGLSEFYFPKTPKNVRVAARWSKGPELLVNYRYYHFSLDTFSLATMFASMLFNKFPVFNGKDNNHQLVAIAKVLGSEKLYEYVNKFDIPLSDEWRKRIGDRAKVNWADLVPESHAHKATPEALDLLEKMMAYDHDERIMPHEALEHPYFKPLDNHPDYPLNRYDTPRDHGHVEDL